MDIRNRVLDILNNIIKGIDMISKCGLVDGWMGEICIIIGKFCQFGFVGLCGLVEKQCYVYRLRMFVDGILMLRLGILIQYRKEQGLLKFGELEWIELKICFGKIKYLLGVVVCVLDKEGNLEVVQYSCY